MDQQLNDRAAHLCEQCWKEAATLGISPRHVGAARVLDFGIEARGGLNAGAKLAEICLSGLGNVSIESGLGDIWPGLHVTVQSDHPVAACLASQYAGWQVAHDGYFAMCSGPIRAAAGREELFDRIGHRESPAVAVGVLETRQFPSAAVCEFLAQRSGVLPGALWLAVAPTASVAGTIQIVARSLETALHKLDLLGFPAGAIHAGRGTAPLPPAGGTDRTAMGRTNDAILYGGDVTLWVDVDDGLILEIGSRVPSSASPDYGRPFLEVFESHQRDFYAMDPMLFSPASVAFVNLQSGRQHRFGTRNRALIEKCLLSSC